MAGSDPFITYRGRIIMFGDVFSHMLHGFAIALTFKGLAMVTIGCVAGTIIGALPGLGPITAIAVMIPMITIP